MFEILEKDSFCSNVKHMVVSAPQIAAKTRPGQFVVVLIHEKAERIPLTIADFDREISPESPDVAKLIKLGAPYGLTVTLPQK